MKRGLILFIGCLAVGLLIICVLSLAWLFIPFFHTWVVFDDQQGRNFISFILSIIQLGGIAIIALVVVLYLFILKRYSLVFNGFKNALILPDAEKRPINISILAQEELVKQFKYLYCSLKQFGNDEDSGTKGLDTDVLIKKPPFVNQHTDSDDEQLLDLVQFLPRHEAKKYGKRIKEAHQIFPEQRGV